jgi:putative transcriptional regulator
MEGFIHLNDLIWLYFNFILKFNIKKRIMISEKLIKDNYL